MRGLHPDGASRAGAPAALRQRRRPAVSMALVLVALLLVGCGGVNELQVGDDDLRFFVHGRTLRQTAGMTAQVVGALGANDGCVLLERDGTRFPVVWPSGTSVVGTAPLVIELPSGEQLGLGEQVSGGGGYVSPGQAGIDVPEECLNERAEVAFFNPDDDPVVDAG